MLSTPEETLAFLEKNEIRFVNLWFSNLYGGWHRLSVPVGRVDRQFFDRGEAFDGASIPGFTRLEHGDMALRPDVTTAFVDPFCEIPTLAVICSVVEADTLEPYVRDPRGIASRAERHLASTGVADQSMWGPEFEFYVFDAARYHVKENQAFYRVESKESNWMEPEAGGHQGYTIPRGGGYHAASPRDRLEHLRTRMVEALEQIGICVRYHHHEVGGPGQCEIEPVLMPMSKVGDTSMIIKHIVKMTAFLSGNTATFMPKPLYGEAGSGLHFHQMLFSKGKPVFHDEDGYAGLSRLALSYVAGVLQHGPSVLAFTNPSTNSYKRLVPGFEAPVNLFYSLANRSAAIRIPKYANLPQEKRIEFRPPDATCNVYLASAAMLMAGIDGIKRDLDPGELGFGPIDENIFTWSDERRRTEITPLPTSVTEAMNALERDHAFLTEGGVFTEEIIDTWISCKRDEELSVRSRPHPFEFELYFDF